MPPTQPAGSWATVSAEVAKPPQQRLASGTSCRAHGGPHWQSRRSRPIATAAAALRVGLPHPPKRTGAHQDAGSLSSGTCTGAHRCECGAPGIPMLRRRQEALPLTHALAARCRGVAATCDAQQQDEAGQAALVAGLLPWQRARAHETQHGLCARVCAKQATREACPWPQDARRNCGWLGAGAERHAQSRARATPPSGSGHRPEASSPRGTLLFSLLSNPPRSAGAPQRARGKNSPEPLEQKLGGSLRRHNSSDRSRDGLGVHEVRSPQPRGSIAPHIPGVPRYHLYTILDACLRFACNQFYFVSCVLSQNNLIYYYIIHAHGLDGQKGLMAITCFSTFASVHYDHNCSYVFLKNYSL